MPIDFEALRKKHGDFPMPTVPKQNLGRLKIQDVKPINSFERNLQNFLRDKKGPSVSTPSGTVRPVGRGKGLNDITRLRRLAEERGLSKQLGRIPQIGEDPDEFGSGGWIMDTFDYLNALQYGITGVLKGKGFKEGIKTRQSFSDEDALGDYGLPGVISGIFLDIAVDPLTYIAPITVLKKIPGATKAAKASKAAFLNTKVGEVSADFLGKRLVWLHGADKVFKDTEVERLAGISKGHDNLKEISRPITELSVKDQRIIYKARKAKKMHELPDELLESSKPLFDELDRLGRESVELGLISEAVYEENVGKYMARLFRVHEFRKGPLGQLRRFVGGDSRLLTAHSPRFKEKHDAFGVVYRSGKKDVVKKFDTADARDVFVKGLKDKGTNVKRVFEPIPDDLLEAWGEILEFGYPTAKAISQLILTNENAKFFNSVAKIYSKEVAEEGLVLLPKTRRLGALSGKYVPEFVANHVNEVIRTRNAFQKATGKIVGTFKFSKVILNPATHARNIMSNLLLNDFEGLSPARIDIYMRAMREVKTKGKFFREAEEHGLGVNTFVAAELSELIAGPEFAKLPRFIRSNGRKLAGLYESEELVAKMAQFIFQRGRGKTASEAMEIAERATFNYAKVTPFIRKMRESIFGYPFITFTYKVTPQVVRTLLTKPGKISKVGKMRNAIENFAGRREYDFSKGMFIDTESDELARERASEPDWIRNGFYLKLPFKDKFGRSAYFDLTYIMPFGDLLAGNFFERGIDRDTGFQKGLVEAGINKLAFPKLVLDLAGNEDFFGNKIFKTTDSTEEVGRDMFLHIFKMMTPPLISDQIPGGYRKDGTKRPGAVSRSLQLETKGAKGIEIGGTETRTAWEELFRNIGLKVSPFDLSSQEGYANSREIQAIQTILEEAGVTREFRTPYVPKKKKEEE